MQQGNGNQKYPIIISNYNLKYPVISTGAQPEIFQGKEGFVEFGHFDKNFIRNTRKEEKFWKFCSRYS